MIRETCVAVARWFRDDTSPLDRVMAVVLLPVLVMAVYAIVAMLIRKA